jgi:hypothetical protein
MNEKTQRIGWVVVLLLAASALAGCGVLDTIKARQLAREGNERYRGFDYRGAIEKYLEAIKLDTEIPNVYINLGYSYFSIYDPSSENELDKKAADEAVKWFDEHLKRFPLDDNARNFQIKMLIKAAPVNKALADRAYATFLGMLQKDPKDKEARQYLVSLFIDCKRYEDAVKFFDQELVQHPDDVVTMKILALIADKSDRTQDALDWYFKRAEVTQDPEKKGVMLYEVGTYAWNTLHFSPGQVTGVEAVKLADQGTEATLKAIRLKDKYAEAMVYANLLYLKRMGLETEEQGKYYDSQLAYDLRTEAAKIMADRKKEQEGVKGPAEGEEKGECAPAPGTTPEPAPEPKAPAPAQPNAG